MEEGRLQKFKRFIENYFKNFADDVLYECKDCKNNWVVVHQERLEWQEQLKGWKWCYDFAYEGKHNTVVCPECFEKGTKILFKKEGEEEYKCVECE